ncbi:transcription initiation factor TFIID subunit 9 [Carex littledalei]|uniref:Transcription initiation factor TFIID subunit 9 n=1 Tax=Carex littledalei TaxID=544730 RepID=A0A833QK32_9POAL|nr:transcription initiation factor TFIID subunit 9 [Carex littledalei]
MDGEGAGNAGMLGSASDEPRDARVLRELLRSMGLSEGEYEPRVLHQLLELAYRNKIPLPKSIAPPGSIPLPPEEDTLISPNYQLLVPTRQLAHNEETDEVTETSIANPNANPNPSVLSEQGGVTEQQSQQALQRVSFQLGPGQRR